MTLDVERFIQYMVENFDHVERIYKVRLLTQRHGNRLYNYTEYLVHAPPGDYDAILVLKEGNSIRAINTRITVYMRGTARYFSFTFHDEGKELLYVLLRASKKKI
jgi:hypothetical protein